MPETSVCVEGLTGNALEESWVCVCRGPPVSSVHAVSLSTSLSDTLFCRPEYKSCITKWISFDLCILLEFFLECFDGKFCHHHS